MSANINRFKALSYCNKETMHLMKETQDKKEILISKTSTTERIRQTKKTGNRK